MTILLHSSSKGFACGSAGKESACNAGDLDSIPGLGRALEKQKLTSLIQVLTRSDLA